MGNWFKMHKYDFYCLITLIVLSVVSFVPFNSDTKIFGIALFGWLQGLLMFVTPTVTLFFVVKGKKIGDDKQ